ncbi:MAG: hypothetical protein SFU25_03505 [Candidatus Caenarcaniphilales bacterium]|nr:hypothetical protein [Candidatus Caenarcaniphilales bacterium]
MKKNIKERELKIPEKRSSKKVLKKIEAAVKAKSEKQASLLKKQATKKSVTKRRSKA